jgi:hypothetical protein
VAFGGTVVCEVAAVFRGMGECSHDIPPESLFLSVTITNMSKNSVMHMKRVKAHIINSH